MLLSAASGALDGTDVAAQEICQDLVPQKRDSCVGKESGLLKRPTPKKTNLIRCANRAPEIRLKDGRSGQILAKPSPEMDSEEKRRETQGLRY